MHVACMPQQASQPVSQSEFYVEATLGATLCYGRTIRLSMYGKNCWNTSHDGVCTTLQGGGSGSEKTRQIE
jgi:hypothetical protein